MSNASMLARLIDKLGHRIADIRDRSMRALCRKILSPVCEWDLVEGLSEIDGVAHLFLLWINERYDFVSSEQLKECFESIARLVSRSQSLRQAFLEAGGPSFFDEFGSHNPSHHNECRNLISLLVGSDGDQSAASREKSDVPNIVQKPIRSECALSSSDEDRLFDLSVRVKFLTSGSSSDQIEELGREIRFGSWMSMDACMFLSKPYLVEALCRQLGRAGQSSASDFEPLAQGLSDIFSRIVHSKPQPHLTISSVIPFIIDSVHRRPDQIKLALSLIEQSLDLADLTDSSVPDQIHRSVSKCMHSVFREDLYQTEVFTFYDKSTVNLGRFTGWSSEYHCLAATLIIRVLAKFTFIGKDESIISHISDWLCDDAFYQHVVDAKSLASMVHSDIFSSAREILLSLRKLTAGSCLSDREVEELFGLWSKVPELFPSNGDATDFMSSLWNSCPSDSSSFVRILRTNRECADGFVSMLSKKTDSNRFSRDCLMKILAVTDCSSPASFVGLMNDKFRVSTPLLSSEAVGDASIEGMARCLFSHSEAVRKQASLVLWKSLEDIRNRSSAFVNDPLRFCDDVLSDLAQYVLSPMQVDRAEIEQAVAIAVNDRLSCDVRTASAVQACTLVSNSKSRGQFSLVGVIIDALISVKSDDLFTALCHLGALLVGTGSKFDLSEPLVKTAVMSAFSAKPNRTRCGMLLLNRIVFRDIDRVMLNRIQQVSFHIFSSCGAEPVKSWIPSVSLQTIAACVSLYGLRDSCCISSVPPSFDALIRGFDSPMSGTDFRRFIREIIWPSKRAFQHYSADSVRKLFSSCISTLSGVIDASPMWITDSPDLVLESLDTLSVALGRCGKKLKAPEVNALPRSVMSLLIRLESQEESSLQIRRAGLRLLLVLSEQMDFSLSDLPMRKWVQDPTEKCHFTLQVSLWFLLKLDDVDCSISHLCRSEDPVVAALAFRLTRSDLDLALLSLENPDTVPSLVFAEHCKLIENQVDEVSFESLLERLERVSDPVRGDAMLGLLVRIASTHGKEIGHYLVSRDLWPQILLRPTGLELAIKCIECDERLVVYLVHCGLFKKNFEIDDCDAVLTLCRMVRNQLCKSRDSVTRFKPALDWMSTCGDWITKIPQCMSLYSLVECVSACLLEQSLPLADAHLVIDVLVSLDPTLCKIDHLRAIIQLLRIPGTMVTDVSSESANSFLSLLRTHESIPLEDNRVSWQIRVISSWTAATSSSIIHQAFSDWFVMMWKRVVLGSLGPTSKNSSLVVRLLTELVCGLLHVLVSHPGSPYWGSPLSEVLSFVTSSGSAIPVPLFSLCLSVAEAAAPETLIGKAVTGRIVSSLMSDYDVERSGTILRFCASLTGCRQAVPEILKYMDTWWSDKVDVGVMERLVASMVLAGGHCRSAIMSNQQAMDFLVNVERENGKSIAATTLEVLASTSVRGMQAVVGRRDN